ncbi:MAG TPA: hypothetical protein VHK01_18695 [Lacipirellulaceae bacterium]|jgi:hypothetical protein|nr:hypothetical protein [Lacipirellulaceae bacterium]
MQDTVPMDDRYAEKRRNIEQFFTPENRVADSVMSHDSASGNYRLEVCSYSTRPNAWGYTRGIATRVADGQVVADVKRNYSHFWHTWVEHPNGNEYLLCGEDYQGYCVINLTKAKYHVYFPEAGHQGWGFCWTAAYPSPDRLTLAVDGCYWACPYELVFYDFRNPDQLPLPELGRIENLVDCEGWVDDDTFVVKRDVEFRKSDGKPYDELTEEEQTILDSDNSLTDYRSDTVRCKRPQPPNDA